MGFVHLACAMIWFRWMQSEAQGLAPRGMTITAADKGQSHELTNVNRRVEKRQTLLRSA